MDYINALTVFVSGLLAIPILVFAIQVFLARDLVGRVDAPASVPRPQLAVLIPAHNEALVIAETLAAIRPQLKEGDHLVVVADNCDDDTAVLSRRHGATVVEREDAFRRGKGYALDHGIRFLANQHPPEVVVIIDADCAVGPDCLDTLARHAADAQRPVQALYLMRSPANKSVGQAIAEFAWLVKNQVRPLGFLRLGLPCQLMGTGMAFPWELLHRANLAHGNMVEDLKLGIDLALAGVPPLFCPSALVTSEFPSSNQVTNKQRARWEHGHLATILAEAPRLFKTALARRDFGLLAMALDLAVPPLSALGLATLAWLLGTGVLASVWGMTVPIGLTTAATLIFFAAVSSAWFRFGRSVLALQTLCAVPMYMFKKIPLYLAFLFKRERGWTKTERR